MAAPTQKRRSPARPHSTPEVRRPSLIVGIDVQSTTMRPRPVDEQGRKLDTMSLPNSPTGYRRRGDQLGQLRTLPSRRVGRSRV